MSLTREYEWQTYSKVFAFNMQLLFNLQNAVDDEDDDDDAAADKDYNDTVDADNGFFGFSLYYH